MTTFRKRALSLVALTISAAALSAGSAAAATPLTVNGGWLTSMFSALGPLDDSPFTFSSNRPMRLEITDTGCAGDQFRLTDNNNKLGDTNFVVPSRNCPGFPARPYVATPEEGWASKQFSHGTYTLLPGTHSINVSLITFPSGLSGDVGIRVDTIKK
jgi:hypothetical protein